MSKEKFRYKKLIVFYPSPLMIETIDNLIENIAPDITYENIVFPDLGSGLIKSTI